MYLDWNFSDYLIDLCCICNQNSLFIVQIIRTTLKQINA